MKQLLDFMETAAKTCGNIMLEADGTRVAAREKTDFRDLVTEYDARIQREITAMLSREYPEASFFCEEGDAGTILHDGLTFVIDPIDGTTNFARGMRHSCLSAAALIDGAPAAGVIYDPFTGEIFSALRGKGTYANGRRVTVAGEPLERSLVLFGTSPYRPDLYRETYAGIGKLYGRCQDLRRSGSAALDLCDTAAGRVGLYYEHSLSLWDYAAGALLVEEAGGVCMRLDGTPMPYTGEKSSIIAGPEQNVRAALKLFGSADQ